MDVLRTSYRKSASFFHDNPATATIKWYKAPPGARTFPTPHKWGSLFWYKFPWEATGVGEDYDTGYTYSKGETPPTAFGKGYFGPLEAFQKGCTYDPTNVTVRDIYGLAVSCARDDDPIPCHGCNVPRVLYGHFAPSGGYAGFDCIFRAGIGIGSTWRTGNLGLPGFDDGYGLELQCNINGLAMSTYYVPTHTYVPGTEYPLTVGTCSPFAATGAAVFLVLGVHVHAGTITEQP